VAKIIDGKMIAEQLRIQIKERVAALEKKPKLAVLLVGHDPASHLYVNLKEQACLETGIAFEKFLYPEDASEEELLAKIAELNADEKVAGILVQLPLPVQDADRVIAAIDPRKDVDGFHPANLESLCHNRPALVSAAALGIRRLIEEPGEDLTGKTGILVMSQRFAAPLLCLLADTGLTLSVIAPEDPQLKETTKTADVLVTAAGRAHFITPEMVKPGAIVIDVGTNKLDGRTVGDVDPKAAEAAGYLTPVPGGVGPMTVAMLLRNILQAQAGREL
jgi:methylenetetrahydrofolate dehydrogenase (NADP+)/methenyltetrahydrofolate cyclohydrolase